MLPLVPPGRRPVFVRVAFTAFLDMVFSTAESATVPQTMTEESLTRLTVWDRGRKGKRVHTSPLAPSLVFSSSGLETAGILAGRRETLAGETAYVVERAFTVTAWRTDNSVGHSHQSPELLDEIAASLDMPWEVVGGFHSHALVEVGIGEIERDRCYMPSAADTEGGPIFWGREIDLVVSVTKAGPIKPDPAPRTGPIVQIRLGEFEFWFVAYQRRNNNLVLEIETRPDPATSPIGDWQRRPPPPF